MESDKLETFAGDVLAIILTVIVLELPQPDSIYGFLGISKTSYLILKWVFKRSYCSFNKIICFFFNLLWTFHIMDENMLIYLFFGKKF